VYHVYDFHNNKLIIIWRPGSRAVDKVRRNAAELSSGADHFELPSGVDMS